MVVRLFGCLALASSAKDLLDCPTRLFGCSIVCHSGEGPSDDRARSAGKHPHDSAVKESGRSPGIERLSGCVARTVPMFYHERTCVSSETVRQFLSPRGERVR